ncbi:MAG: hypothetical protein HRU09_12735 [Oligoflexales bacterium]|nr:hypothetical protein [Oligoflexales bacterium]
MLKYAALLITVACIAACGGLNKKSKEEFKAPELLGSQVNRGLAFTGVDLYYSSSDLYFYDYEQGLVSGLLYGQSGDSALWSLSDQLVLFNRTSTHHNFVRFEKDASENFYPSQETSGGFEKGDPGDVIVLDNGNWLLSFFGKGKVAEINPDTGEEIQKIVFDPTVPLRPSAMFKRRIEGTSYIFIANLGIEIDPSSYKTIANGKQGIFIVREDKDGLTVLNDGKLVSKPLASNPGFYHTTEENPIVAGLCYKGSQGCTQAIETLNVRSAIEGTSTTPVLSSGRTLDIELLSMNGSLCDGLDADSLYANVVFNQDQGKFKKAKKYIVSIRSQEEINLDLVHHYAHPDSSGAYLLSVDKSINALFFGDFGNDGQASLNILRNGELKIIPMKRIPYQGALSRK